MRVLYADMDAAGVAHHARYARWLEAGRTEAMRAEALPYAELERAGVLIPVVELALSYRPPVRYDDVLVIRTGIAEVGRVRVRFFYSLGRPGETKPVATAETLHAFVDREGRIRRLDRRPEHWARVRQAAARLAVPPT